jgi:hypothetical protein
MTLQNDMGQGAALVETGEGEQHRVGCFWSLVEFCLLVFEPHLCPNPGLVLSLAG